MPFVLAWRWWRRLVLTALVSGVHGRDVNDASLQFQLGTLLFEETRYREALEAFRKAVGADSKSIAIQARIGVVKSALRLGEFIEAQHEADHPQAAGAAQRRRARRARRRVVVGGLVRRGAPGIQGRARRWCPTCRAAITAWPARSRRRTSSKKR